MRYGLIGFAILALLFPFAGIQAQAGVTVTAQVRASLRQGPSRQTTIIDFMPENASAMAVARSADNAWVQATYHTVTGWIAVRQLTIHGDLNSLPVSAGSATTSAAPVTHSLTLATRRVFRAFTAIDSHATSVIIQNDQLGVVESYRALGTATGYFNVTVVDGRIALSLATVSTSNAIPPVSQFDPAVINQLNARFSDALNNLVRALVGAHNVVAVDLQAGQLVIQYTS